MAADCPPLEEVILFRLFGCKKTSSNNLLYIIPIDCNLPNFSGNRCNNTAFSPFRKDFWVNEEEKKIGFGNKGMCRATVSFYC